MWACFFPQLSGILSHTAADGCFLNKPEADNTNNRELVTHSPLSSKMKGQKNVAMFGALGAHCIKICLIHTEGHSEQHEISEEKAKIHTDIEAKPPPDTHGRWLVGRFHCDEMFDQSRPKEDRSC